MELSNLFESHMVFQANKPVNLFGSGKGTVKVEINGHSIQTNVDDNWTVTLPPSDYSGPHTLTVTMNEETKVFDDIYFGDVFLLAGQSNIEFKLGQSTYDKANFKSNNLIRLFSSERPVAGEFFHPEDGWVILDAQTAQHWSAIGYHIAEEINAKAGHAIGLVTCYQGGTGIQSWLPLESLVNTKAYIPFEERRYNKYWNNDGYNYDLIFKKLTPFSFKAVIWYQGETNHMPAEAKNYHFMLTTLIDLWREDLNDKELPFIVIQISDYHSSKNEGWRTVQTAQIKIAETMDNVYSIISADVCEINEIHPPTKIHLSKRVTERLLNI